MSEHLPAQFGNYVLLDRIARGGMAEIYRAEMAGGIDGFAKQVAIKKILPHLAENNEFITMLVDEARICVALNHSNIAQIYDLGREQGSYFIAMEFVNGVDLAGMLRHLEEQGYLMPVEHAVFVTKELCAALYYAHNKTDKNGAPLNIVHRDVSPHNILVSFTGDVKIVDFGIAKATVKLGQTQMGVIKGKLLYMAPEQAMGHAIDGRVDVFGAGMCLYKMLTGYLPYEADDAYQIYSKVLKAKIEPPRNINPLVPESLNRACMKALTRPVKKRYQDAWAFHQDLSDILHEIAPGYTSFRLEQFMEQYFAHEKKGGPDTSGGYRGSRGSNPSSPSAPRPQEDSYPPGPVYEGASNTPAPEVRSYPDWQGEASPSANTELWDVIATTEGWMGTVADLSRLVGQRFGIDELEVEEAFHSLQRACTVGFALNGRDAEQCRQALARMGISAIVRKTEMTRVAESSPPMAVEPHAPTPPPDDNDENDGLSQSQGTGFWMQAVDNLWPEGQGPQPPRSDTSVDVSAVSEELDAWGSVLEPGARKSDSDSGIDIDVDFDPEYASDLAELAENLEDADETQRVPMNWRELLPSRQDGSSPAAPPEPDYGPDDRSDPDAQAMMPDTAEDPVEDAREGLAVSGPPSPTPEPPSPLSGSMPQLSRIESGPSDPTGERPAIDDGLAGLFGSLDTSVPPPEAEPDELTRPGGPLPSIDEALEAEVDRPHVAHGPPQRTGGSNPSVEPSVATPLMLSDEPEPLSDDGGDPARPTTNIASVGTRVGIPAASSSRAFLAATLSMVCPGAGQIFNGQIFKGVLFGATSFLLLPWLIAVIDAFRTSRKMAREGTPPPGVGYLIAVFFYGLMWLLFVLGVGTLATTLYTQYAEQQTLEQQYRHAATEAEEPSSCTQARRG